ISFLKMNDLPFNSILSSMSFFSFLLLPHEYIRPSFVTDPAYRKIPESPGSISFLYSTGANCEL
ncbi:MAG: hypothetical protein IIU29_02380, partial [Erysipelotrichaceae bacterium]|nr:hypothetical protein [Erysipelotrichaceae bacterium]